MPLVYLPDVESLFLWGTEPAPRGLPALAQGGDPWSATLVAPEGLSDTSGVKLPLFDSMAKLAVVPAADIGSLPGSVATWVLASKLAMELVARERVVPTISRRGGRIEARWAAALAASEDAAKVAAIAKSMSPAAHAVPVAGERSGAVWAPDALCGPILDAIVDALVRTARGGPRSRLARPGVRHARRRAKTARAAPDAWEERWRTALGGDQAQLRDRGVRGTFGRRRSRALERAGPRRARSPARVLPARAAADDREPFLLRFLLQSPDDPSLLVPAPTCGRRKGGSLAKLGRAFRDPQESLLEALGRAARLFPPIARMHSSEAKPASARARSAAAWAFLATARRARGGGLRRHRARQS